MNEKELKTVYDIFTFYWKLVKENKDIKLKDDAAWTVLCNAVNDHLEQFDDELEFDFAQAVCIATLKIIDKKARERDGQ